MYNPAVLWDRCTVFGFYSRFANTFVTEEYLEPVISQVRSPVPFSRVSYIYDHLAHWGDPLTSKRIAPTHAFW